MANHLKQLFHNLGIRCVLDVGANVGQYRWFLRNEVGYAGSIVSFEPVAAHVVRLREAAAQDRSWVICPYALGREEGTLSLNVMRNRVLTSFLSPDTVAVPEMRDQNVVDHLEQVPVRRLDSVLAELDLAVRPGETYLKLDTQGFDLEVIDGAGDVLSNLAALQTELSWRPLYRGMPGYQAVLKRLDEKGFDVTGFFPVVRDRYLRIVEMDGVLINRKIVGRSGSLGDKPA
jgi:FkbM family methyltransferase